MYISLTLVVIFLLEFGALYAQDHVPSKGEIDDLDDPVLKEIFSHKTQPSPSGPSSSGNYQPVYTAPTDINHSHGREQVSEVRNIGGFNSQPYNRYNARPYSNYGHSNSDGYNFENLAAQGAQTFYSGVQQAGQLFGFNFGR